MRFTFGALAYAKFVKIRVIRGQKRKTLFLEKGGFLQKRKNSL